MPQKQPPAKTAVSSDLEEASGASTAGLGKADLALARPSLGLAVAQARTPIPPKSRAEMRIARMSVVPRKLSSIEVYAWCKALDDAGAAYVAGGIDRLLGQGYAPGHYAAASFRKDHEGQHGEGKTGPGFRVGGGTCFRLNGGGLGGADGGEKSDAGRCGGREEIV